MMYFAVFLVLFVLELLYFRIADKFNIIDKPNHRSSHTQITLRGGGIVFPIAFLLFLGSHIFNENSIINLQNYLIFGIGLLAICVISFMDDVLDLSSKIRLVFHFISVTLLLYFINAFQLLPIWAIPILFIMIIGILNAYNFMDGINGITGLYSMVILGSLLYVNQYVMEFTDINFIIYPLIACLVFLFFNFRKKAKCFMGDVGSMGIVFWIIALIGLLILKTENFKYLFFLTIYGVDVVFTILERLKLKENIFEAHRRHLYQLFANEKKVSHLIISSFYAMIQLLINVFLINSNFNLLFISLIVLIPIIIIYLFLKNDLKKRVIINHSKKN
jgi:UDP-N-acetylmuramyl pentapeptide phosphotransferase/UDP-N-acetylglucosamine-1-phosphate transferase